MQTSPIIYLLLIPYLLIICVTDDAILPVLLSVDLDNHTHKKGIVVALEDEMKMIYIYRSNDKIKEDDSLRQITNCYSRYEDKDLCEMYASDFEDKMGYKHRIVRTKKNKEQADNNRRLAQIYNRICEGYGDSYDEDTIRKVYKYVTNKNKTVIDEIDKKQSQEYMSSSDKDYVKNLQSQIRDTLIFEQFDYLNEDSQDGNSDEDIWGEIDAIENGYTVEEILEMPMPVASTEMIANLKTLQEMGAISKETIMEKTEYVSDVEVEKKRLSGENVSQDVSQKVDNPSKKVEIK